NETAAGTAAAPATPAKPAGKETASSKESPRSNTAPDPSANAGRPQPDALAASATPGSETDPELVRKAADGFLINGSVNNGAASPFSQSNAFGNFRHNSNSRYNGNIGLTFDNSAFDARQYSLTGQDTPKPSYSRFQGMLSFGGPIRIPRLLKNGPNL